MLQQAHLCVDVWVNDAHVNLAKVVQVLRWLTLFLRGDNRRESWLSDVSRSAVLMGPRTKGM